jgi:hypothetical protein
MITTEQIIKTYIEQNSEDLYFDTYTSALQQAEKQAEKDGFEISDDDWFSIVSVGPKKPSKGKTVKLTLPLSKNGKPQRKALHVQVYNRGTNRNTYELNYYIS